MKVGKYTRNSLRGARNEFMLDRSAGFFQELNGKRGKSKYKIAACEGMPCLVMTIGKCGYKIT